MAESITKLSLTRRVGEKIVVEGEEGLLFTFHIGEIKGKQVNLKFNATSSIKIYRGEIYAKYTKQKNEKIADNVPE